MDETEIRRHAEAELKKTLKKVKDKKDGMYMEHIRLTGFITPDEYIQEMVNTGMQLDDPEIISSLNKISKICNCDKEKAILFYSFTDIVNYIY